VPLLRRPGAAWRTDALLESGRNGERPAWRAVRDARFQLTVWDGGERELYDLRADPHQLDNQATDPAIAPVRARLERRLAALGRCRGAARWSGPARRAPTRPARPAPPAATIVSLAGARARGDAIEVRARCEARSGCGGLVQVVAVPAGGDFVPRTLATRSVRLRAGPARVRVRVRALGSVQGRIVVALAARDRAGALRSSRVELDGRRSR